ncbi:hypothetical protein BU26DRAFT_510487 [Trematosphaeria pertusa]|uniref:Uncharacterized protein n=1 Tax=Trematosphaeria pertusa TaxID=390896 RepID=A0A6A6HXZ6_9PLEO|nr:uncharacterized protein BU26DRAFT_510487 [Trematosphaeria pertusa]KAF2242658.1 hypothetical protein BU26DRAFT_510487 [Trematosphaeria pertusa]
MLDDISIKGILGKDIDEAVNSTASYVPYGAPNEVNGNPVLYWVDQSARNPNEAPQPPNKAYSEYTKAEQVRYGILSPAEQRAQPSTLNPQAAAFAPAAPTQLTPQTALPRKSVEEIVNELLSPGFSITYRGVDHQGMATIDLPFVVRCMRHSGQEHLEFSHQLGRVILRRDSELLERGRELGLPDLYMKWLAGANGEHKLRIPLVTLRNAAMSNKEKK